MTSETEFLAIKLALKEWWHLLEVAKKKKKLHGNHATPKP